MSPTPGTVSPCCFLSYGLYCRLSKHLIPTYNLGCKRVLLSDDYLPVFSEKPTCTLVTERIQSVTTTGIRTDKALPDITTVAK